MIITINQLSLIVRNTIKSIYQTKVLFNIAIIAAVLMAATFIATKFTYGVPQKVAIDIGLGLLTISSLGIALSLGVGLLADEIQNRTLYVVLARAVSRHTFLWGKFIGLSIILMLNVAILGMVTCAINLFLGGEVNTIILFAILFIFLEAWLLLSLTIFISLIASRSITIMITISIWVAGHSVDSAMQTLFSKHSPLINTILNLYKLIFPNFYKLNLKDYVIYQQELSGQFYLNGICYALVYGTLLMIFSGIIFNRKNFD